MDYFAVLQKWVPYSQRYLFNATSRSGSTCVDLVEDCEKATSIHFFISQESKVKTKKTESVLIKFDCTHHKTISIKLCRRRPARSPSFARTASAAETVVIKPQISSRCCSIFAQASSPAVHVVFHVAVTDFALTSVGMSR